QAQANHYARAYPTIHDDVEPEGEQAGSAAAQSPALAELPPPVPSPWLTPGVLAIIAVLAAPLSLVLLALGAWIMPADETEYVSVGPVLMALAFSLFVVQFLYRVLKHPDLCPVHFGWSLETQRQLLKFLSRFTWVLLPTTLILATAQQQTVSLTTDSLGVLTLIFASLAIAYLFRRLLRRLPAIHKKVPLYWALNGLLVVLPLVLVVLTATGYYYTSLQLTARLLATFYVLTGWVIAEVTVMRGVELATEKLRRQRAEEIIQFKALTAHESMSAGAMVTPLPTLDLTQVTQQSLRLAQFLILLGFGGLMYWVWADLVGVLAGLNDWALWREVATLDAATDMITLLDIITAIIIVVLTFFFAANLPGLLEMTVLSRLSLQQGSAYAITTLLNYVITATGLVMALSALGVSWDKLQWLVAALSVGLGFGLQEIFANFVSGLIILFERPIRIGDVVTLGNLSGTVSQIRIRATTITEFDRKEIIVPNKTFVTGQLINWSLSDTVTRVIVKLGVAYGSDLDKTRSLLFEAADQNPRVLNDPTPQVLFLNFGASTLDHELRIHVKELGDRNPVIDEINRFVDREFKAAGIEIAFQQIDIRLRNSDGLERVIKQKPSASPPGPLPE
ncbi:MAG: mechanosensitive ion channel domain-containing protein, partial [Natronospirillum sp.]